MKLTDSEKNAFKAVEYLLYKSGQKVTSSTLKEKLWNHSDFPGMTSISDVLDELKVPNMALQISSQQLSTIPLPALAFLHVDDGIFVPIKSISNGSIEWLHTSLGMQKEDIDSFASKWTGVTLLIEPQVNSGEINYKQKRKKEIFNNLRIPYLLLSLIVSAFILFASEKYSVPDNLKLMVYLLTGLKLAGVIVSFMLVWYSLDASNTFLRSICNLKSKNNCGSILESNAAKLFGILSWAEIGLIYFAVTPLITIVSGFTGYIAVVLPWVVVLNLLALPFIVYSLSYQAFVAKQWCILCISVLLLLCGEFLVASAYLPITQLKLSSKGWGLISMVFLLVVASWILIKPGIINSIKIKPLQRAFNRIKWDPIYIQSLLGQQRYIPPIFEGMSVGQIGNPDAPNTLILVTNPKCEACARIHKEVELLIQNTTEIRLQFIIAGADGDLSSEIAKDILSLPEPLIPVALHHWFTKSQKVFAKWIRDNQVKQNISDGSNQLNLHLRWLELAGIANTPFLLLNGLELPRNYTIAEVEKLCKQFHLSRI